MEAREIVTHLRVDGFDGGGQRLGLYQQILRDNATVDFPFIRRHREWLQVCEARPEPSERFSATAAHFNGKDASRGTRHSNPYP